MGFSKSDPKSPYRNVFFLMSRKGVLFFCPRRGLPRSSATILIDLVCLSVVCVSEIWPKFAEEGSAGFIQSSVCVISRPSKTGPEKKRPLRSWLRHFRDPVFEQLFSKINISKTPCPEGVCRRRYHSVNLSVNVGLGSWHST